MQRIRPNNEKIIFRIVDPLLADLIRTAAAGAKPAATANGRTTRNVEDRLPHQPALPYAE